jgi:hypothetical protein
MSQLIVAGSYQLGDSSIANGLTQMDKGDYVIAGRVFGRTGDSVAAAVRVDQSANVVWQEIYSAPFTTFFKSIAQTNDGTLAATGSYFYSPLAGDEYIWIVKLNEDGGKVWEQAYGSLDQQSDGEDIAPTSDGGFIVAGLFLLKGTEQAGTWVLKFGSDNQLEWEQRFDIGVTFSIRQTRDGGYILAGAHNIPDSLNSNPFVLRLDAMGNRLWEQIYTDYEVYVLLDSDLVETQNGNFIAVFKSVLMEIDCCGRIIWARQSGDLNLGAVALLRDGRPVVGGSLIVNNFDHAYVAALREEGRLIRWDNTEISFPSGITEIILNNRGFIAGTGYLPNGGNGSQMFLVVYNPVELITQ